MRREKLQARILGSGERSGVALVITLLMLSVITFMAIAFLAVSRRERASVAGSLNQVDAQAMADAALARAQADVAAYLMAHNTNANPGSGRPNDLLNYDMMMSHDFINPVGFTPGINDPTNVNFDYHSDAGRTPMTSSNEPDWIENIANLLYDPRVPVFVPIQTNTIPGMDFRYWLDYNRNGRFESNGLIPTLDSLGNANGGTELQYGEPEWIGALRQPDTPHGSNNNTFIGRYAYLVLPIGKTLDLNFIHNYAKGTASGFPQNMPFDGYLRNQGHGPWELNMAALLAGVNSNLWGTDYVYAVQGNGVPNSGVSSRGVAFIDALSFLKYRYNSNIANLLPLKTTFPNDSATFGTNNIDEYSDGPIPTTAYDAQFPENDDPSQPWPGSTNYNNFYEPQDIFDKLANTPFVGRLTNALAQLDTTNRYTFSRLLASIGTDSDPELYCWVHEDNGTLVKRAKVNINYDNSQAIRVFDKDPVHAKLTTPVGLTNWEALNFFTNTAELLLRSQDFELITNDFFATNLPPSSTYVHFGVTNIMIYSSANTNIHYTSAVHRMLQLAANIYDASGNNVRNPSTGIMYPSVFRPIFETAVEGPNTPRATNFYVYRQATNVYIVGYTNVVNSSFRTNQFRTLTQAGIIPIGPNDNVWGVPLVVGAKKGLPNFNKFAYSTIFDITRKLKFFKTDVQQTAPTKGFQMYVMSISNLFGVEGWNSYTNTFQNGVNLLVTNAGQITLVNEMGAHTNTGYTNYIFTNIAANTWRGSQSAQDSTTIKPASFVTVLTNIVALPWSQYSEQKTNFQVSPLDTDYQRFAVTYPLGYPVHDWRIVSTNYVFYLLTDQSTDHVLDVVMLGELTNSVSINQSLLNKVPPPRVNNWDTNGANNQITSPMSLGVQHQLQVVTNSLNDPDWPNGSLAVQKQDKNFVDFMTSANGELSHECPFSPSATLMFRYHWEANDPLVHYTIEDLTSPQLTNEIVYMEPNPNRPTNILTRELGFANMNTIYSPWNQAGAAKDLQVNMTFKDPMVMQSAIWDFPTNKFPSIGWLGRVHRGSPWQTFYLKSEGGDPKTDHNNWAKLWSSSITSYPTNDWRILDLFTVAPTENAARGLLSINQTNLGPWSALLSGLYILTNNSSGFVLDPTNVPALVTDINNLRLQQDNQVFHHLGDFLGAPQVTRSLLTTLNLIPNEEDPPRKTISYDWDEVVERIPQQILSLVKLGDPRFVIYSFGQSLKPANNSLVLGGQYRGMCTNYQITGEVVTRTVCRLSNDSTPTNPKIIVESFNILPGN